MICKGCGSEFAREDGYCGNCGGKIDPPPQKSKMAVLSVWMPLIGIVCTALGFVINPAFFAGLALSGPAGVVLGVAALIAIKLRCGRVTGTSYAVPGIVLSATWTAFLGLIIYPVFAHANETARKFSCQNNVRELGIAVTLYLQDYDSALPSSYLYGRSAAWNRDHFIHFAADSGKIPPAENQKWHRTWPELLYPYLKNRHAIWCPSDSNFPGYDKGTESTRISYFWKAASDRAWYAGRKSEADYDYPADQIILYEHNGWHDQPDKGLSDGVWINCVYLDSHAKYVQIRNSGFKAGDEVSPLPPSGGEPAWYNRNTTTGKSSRGENWNPRFWNDNLQ